ncbi:hypothetical protein [Streptomyces candidus]|uniref:Uncharacterized protein n=1 Tax=Streptomyces candidus TaxID=67283 RepID=A0A7X0HI22_9ACTN|nr:hypothetical protein [Streptomyces candidus]MBB6436732.1 hypothetical protein [Streptomyces candidus]GHH51211.1 hypothetical protein GCM10018773_49440 [Streptomyces candidus]
MPQGSSTPPAGQAEIAAFVRECWRRKSSRPLPLVVLLGRPGSGKTHALDHFAHEAAGGITARIDFAPLPVQRPYETALLLAFQLTRKHPGVHPPRFPRLMLGLLALNLSDLPVDNRDAARKQLKAALTSARSSTAVGAAETAGGVLDNLGLSPVPNLELAAGLLVRGFTHLPAATVLNRALASYGQGSAQAGVEALIDLNRRARSGIEADTELVDRMLCEVFLDDLTASFAKRSRLYNCLALLDNIDRPHVTRFLQTLCRLRAEKARAGTYDPLLIVATAATTRAVPGPGDGSPDDPHIRRCDALSYAAWRPRPDGPPPDWWCPVRLRDLEEVEVALEATRYERERSRESGRPEAWVLPRAAPLIHRLTYGHPWSVRTLHDVVAALRDGQAPTDGDLRGLLRARPPRAGLPVTDVVHGRLLAGLTADQQEAALLVAAARTPRAAVNAGLLNDQPEHARDTLMRELRERLWLSRRVPEDAYTRGGRGPSGYLLTTAGSRGEPAADSTYDTQPVLHPWLRLLLLERLSAPPSGSLERWRALHSRLASWHQRQHHPLDCLYHRLAKGELQSLVDHLARGVGAADLTPWLRELYHVTAAPMYRAWLSDGPPRRQASELARELAPDAYADQTLGRPLAELCAALWLAGDPRNRLPLGNPELNHKISAMLRQVATAADADADTLLDEAIRYTD